MLTSTNSCARWRPSSDPWVPILGAAPAAWAGVHHGVGEHIVRLLDPHRDGSRSHGSV